MENNKENGGLDGLIEVIETRGRESDNPDYAALKFKELLHHLWDLTSLGQKLVLLRKPAILYLTKDLEAEVAGRIAHAEAEVTAAGYRIVEVGFGFSWKSDREHGKECPFRADAVADAYVNLYWSRVLSGGISPAIGGCDTDAETTKASAAGT